MAGHSAFIRAIGSGIGSVVRLPKQGTKLREKSTSRKRAERRESRQDRCGSGKKVKMKLNGDRDQDEYENERK